MQGCLEGGRHRCAHAVHGAEQRLRHGLPEPLGKVASVRHSNPSRPSILHPLSSVIHLYAWPGQQGTPAMLDHLQWMVPVPVSLLP